MTTHPLTLAFLDSAWTVSGELRVHRGAMVLVHLGASGACDGSPRHVDVHPLGRQAVALDFDNLTVTFPADDPDLVGQFAAAALRAVDLVRAQVAAMAQDAAEDRS